MIKETCRFSHSFCRESGVLTIRINGEIDHHNAVGMRGDMDKLIFDLMPSTLALDLARVDFMDSSGLGLIMGRYSLISKLGKKMILLDPNPRTVKIIKLAGLDRMITIKSTLSEGDKVRVKRKEKNNDK